MKEWSRELEAYRLHLYEQEKSKNTIEKYIRDVKKFLNFAAGEEIDRELALQYKEALQGSYQTSSVNSMLIALNGFLRFVGRGDCQLKICRVQRQIFRAEERELDRKEYQRLVREAGKQGKDRLCHILQTIACTGIRIGELQYITAEALRTRRVRIDFKGKVRIIILPRSLTLALMDYCRRRGIRRGQIFVTKGGRPVDRRNIWAEMKKLCLAARVQASKVFPHNLRHLFAKCFYEREKDIARLADYLGHSSVETTRRYTMISSMEVCERQLELGLLMAEKKE